MCGTTIAPTSEDLAEIAVESAKTAAAFGIKPKVAMLSFSTKGSAQSEETEKVVKATRLAKKMDSSILIEGELQFDASIVPEIAVKKGSRCYSTRRCNCICVSFIRGRKYWL